MKTYGIRQVGSRFRPEPVTMVHEDRLCKRKSVEPRRGNSSSSFVVVLVLERVFSCFSEFRHDWACFFATTQHRVTFSGPTNCRGRRRERVWEQRHTRGVVSPSGPSAYRANNQRTSERRFRYRIVSGLTYWALSASPTTRRSARRQIVRAKSRAAPSRV